MNTCSLHTHTTHTLTNYLDNKPPPRKHTSRPHLTQIERADTDQDGEISPEEFYSIMTKKTFT